jgi:N-acetylglucosamine kinase-like BadF-type ATPase
LALVADADGRVLGRGAVGSSNYQSMDAVAAQDALDDTVAAAYADARLAVGPPAVLCLGLAGVDRPEDRAFVQGWLARAMPGIPVAIVNDARLVLAAGTSGGWAQC